MADSYNELFGLGSHSEDSALEGWWKLQESSGTTVNDDSSNGNDGTINDAPLLAQTGPNGWLPNAYKFDNGSERYTVDVGLDFRDDWTLTFFTRVPTSNTFNYLLDYLGTTFDSLLEVRKVNFASTLQMGYKAGTNTVVTATSVDDVTDTTPWVHLCLRRSGNDVQIFVDGSASGSAASHTDTTTSAKTDYIVGCRRNATNGWNGYLAHHTHFSRALTTSEMSEIEDGPEPINTVAPAVTGTETVGSVLTSTSGTWDSQSNGTITYAYQWTRSDNASGLNEADISGATSSTYTLVAGDSGKFIRCRVRATNDGGFDSAADTDSNMSGAIGSGGGGVTVPVFAHHYRSLATA